MAGVEHTARSEQGVILEVVRYNTKATQSLSRFQGQEPPLPPIVIIDPFVAAIPSHRALVGYAGKQGDTASERGQHSREASDLPPL